MGAARGASGDRRRRDRAARAGGSCAPAGPAGRLDRQVAAPPWHSPSLPPGSARKIARPRSTGTSRSVSPAPSICPLNESPATQQLGPGEHRSLGDERFDFQLTVRRLGRPPAHRGHPVVGQGERRGERRADRERVNGASDFEPDRLRGEAACRVAAVEPELRDGRAAPGRRSSPRRVRRRRRDGSPPPRYRPRPSATRRRRAAGRAARRRPDRRRAAPRAPPVAAATGG